MKLVVSLGTRIRAFLMTHPDSSSADVRAALGDTAATYVAQLAVHGHITRRRIGWQWHYSAARATPLKRCGKLFDGFRSRIKLPCTLPRGHKGGHVHDVAHVAHAEARAS